MTNDTLYDLASNTKMYTANYALQYLVTQGKANLDSRLVDLLGSAFVETPSTLPTTATRTRA